MPRLGYRVWEGQSGDYRRCTVEIREIIRLDASKELEANVGRSSEEYYLNRLRAVKAKTGGAVFYNEEFGRETVEIAFQGNGTIDSPDGEYYAPRVETRLSPSSVKMLNRVVRKLESLRGTSDYTPALVRSALGDLRAIEIEYMAEEFGIWTAVQAS